MSQSRKAGRPRLILDRRQLQSINSIVANTRSAKRHTQDTALPGHSAPIDKPTHPPPPPTTTPKHEPKPALHPQPTPTSHKRAHPHPDVPPASPPYKKPKRRPNRRPNLDPQPNPPKPAQAPTTPLPSPKPRYGPLGGGITPHSQPTPLSAPRAPSPDRPLETHGYAPYTHLSLSILHSTAIAHEPYTLPASTPRPARLAALSLLHASHSGTAPGLISFERAVRPRRASSEREVVVVDAVDLYVCEDVVYVASRRGLVAVPEYLRLAGVAADARVRFEGRVPAWAKVALGRCEVRRVLKCVRSEELGMLGLRVWDLVVVLEKEGGGGDGEVWCWGRNLEGGRVGRFPWGVTESLGEEIGPEGRRDWMNVNDEAMEFLRNGGDGDGESGGKDEGADKVDIEGNGDKKGCESDGKESDGKESSEKEHIPSESDSESDIEKYAFDPNMAKF